MSQQIQSQIPSIVRNFEEELLNAWVADQEKNVRQRALMKGPELRQQCSEFLRLLREAAQGDHWADTNSAAWDGVRDLLAEVSRARGLQGFSPAETATFVLSLKRPLIDRLRREVAGNGPAFAEEIWRVNEVLDQLALFTTEVYQKSREEVIARQQQEVLELSTPVVKLWEGVLALPLIGTLDSARTQVVMENLLEMIVSTGAATAIIDITGVPTVDTLVAQHLIKTVTAARLMGADCIISGIRPQIAQTIVHLGVDLTNISTKASLADAFALALRRNGLAVTAVK